jgi:hypothetical protein
VWIPRAICRRSSPLRRVRRGCSGGFKRRCES